MRRAIAAALFATCSAGLAGADPMTSDAAKAQLFPTDAMIVHVLDTSVFKGSMKRYVEQSIKQLRSRRSLRDFLAAGYAYYGGVAFPVDGYGDDVPESIQLPTIATQLNTPGAAQRAAVEKCQELYGATCAAAALLLPKGYQTRDLTLSQAASHTVLNKWSGTSGPRYLAYSPSTEGWGTSEGSDATARRAIEDCKKSDCIIAIADE